MSTSPDDFDFLDTVFSDDASPRNLRNLGQQFDALIVASVTEFMSRLKLRSDRFAFKIGKVEDSFEGGMRKKFLLTIRIRGTDIEREIWFHIGSRNGWLFTKLFGDPENGLYAFRIQSASLSARIADEILRTAAST